MRKMVSDAEVTRREMPASTRLVIAGLRMSEMVAVSCERSDEIR